MFIFSFRCPPVDIFDSISIARSNRESRLAAKEWSWKKKRWEAYRLWKASYFNGYDYSHAMPIPACVLSVIRYRFTDPRDDLSFTGTFRIDDGVFAGREFAIDSYY